MKKFIKLRIEIYSMWKLKFVGFDIKLSRYDNYLSIK